MEIPEQAATEPAAKPIPIPVSKPKRKPTKKSKKPNKSLIRPKIEPEITKDFQRQHSDGAPATPIMYWFNFVNNWRGALRDFSGF